MRNRLLLILLVLIIVPRLMADNQIVQKRQIIIGGDYNYPPYEYLDEYQIPRGYNIDLSRAIAREMGFEVQFRLGKWSRVMEWLEQGEIDLIQGMAFSPQRAKQYHFSNPHAQTWRSIFVHKDSQIREVKDILAAQIVLQQGDIAQDYLREINYLGNKIDVPTQVDALHLVDSGTYDAAIANYMNARFMIDQTGLKNIRALPERIQPREYCYASLDIDLINDINAGISILSRNGKLDELHTIWFSAYDLNRETRLRAIKKVLWIVIPTLLFLFAGLLWVWLIKRRVTKQTRHLRVELQSKERLENELRREYELFFSGPVVVFKASPEQLKLELISDNVSQFGLSAQELTAANTPLECLIALEDRDEFLQKSAELIQRKISNVTLPLRICGESGTIKWIIIYILTAETAEGNPIIYGYLIDIDKQKNLEHELLGAKEKAEFANIAKGQFLANMSHEIRTPLNGIMGFIQVLQQQDATAKQRKLYDVIYSSGKNVMLFVNDILDFSKIESGRLELQKVDFNPAHMIEEIIKGFIYRREKPQLEIKSRISSQIPPIVHGDMLRLRQVFINLLHNAVKFTHEGWIEVSADIYTQRDDELRLIFSISDTGVGIEPQKQQDIFDNFVQTDLRMTAVYGGTGLGLSIVKKLVEIMGGFIWVESELNNGSSFFLILPFKKVQPADTEKVKENLQQSIPLHPTRKLNIMLVEDEPINQIVTKKQLERWGHRVTVASNGEIAVQLYKNNEFDCILMDIQMPVKDGVSATLDIRDIEFRSGKHTIIYAFTAAAMVGDRERFLAAGMDDYISKPVDTRLLFELLNRVDGQQDV